jgi:hypothetical protein
MGLTSDGRPDRRHVTGATEKAVIAKVRRLEQTRAAGRVTRPGRPPALQAWLENWLSTIVAVSLKPKTLEGYASQVRVHLVPGLGRHRLDQLQPEHVERLYLQLLNKGVKPASIHSTHRVLRAALNAAVERDKLPRSPLCGVRPPRVTVVEIEPLNKEELGKITKVAAGRCNGARWLVALALGQRQGKPWACAGPTWTWSAARCRSGGRSSARPPATAAAHHQPADVSGPATARNGSEAAS